MMEIASCLVRDAIVLDMTRRRVGIRSRSVGSRTPIKYLRESPARQAKPCTATRGRLGRTSLRRHWLPCQCQLASALQCALPGDGAAARLRERTPRDDGASGPAQQPQRRAARLRRKQGHSSCTARQRLLADDAGVRPVQRDGVAHYRSGTRLRARARIFSHQSVQHASVCQRAFEIVRAQHSPGTASNS